MKLKIGLALIIGIVLTVFVIGGMRWRLEWNNISGKQRTVRLFYAIELKTEPETSTILSEWKGEVDHGGDWIQVAFGPTHFGSYSWNYIYIDSDLRSLESTVKNPKNREQYAEWILSSFRENLGFGSVRSQSDRAVGAIKEFYFIENGKEELSLEQLQQLWVESKQAEQAVPPKSDRAGG